MQPANRILFQGHTTHSSPTLELALPPQQAAQGFFSPRASQVAQLVKNLPAMQETWAQPLGWEDSLKEGRLPTPVFWPGEFHGLYTPWGHKE